MDLTTPGGKIKNSTIEHFVDEEVKLDGINWEKLENMNTSTFLNLKGWPFDERTIMFSSMNGQKIDLKNYHKIELSKYGQCHVFTDLPDQKLEGSGQGLRVFVNIVQSAYSLNELKINEEMVEGVKSGVRVFIDDAESEQYDYRYGTDVPVGGFTRLELTKKIDEFLPPPHGICNQTVTFKTYSQCFNSWYLNQVEKLCGCTSFFDSRARNVSECTLKNVIDCKKELIELKNKKPSDEDCPQQCEVVSFNVDSGYTDFATARVLDKFSESYTYVLDELKMHLNFAVEQQTTKETMIAENILAFEIYYKDFVDVISVEEKKLNFIGLIADLSAVWSIWAGFSMLSIINVGFVCISIVISFLKATTFLFKILNRMFRSFDFRRNILSKDKTFARRE